MGLFLPDVADHQWREFRPSSWTRGDGAGAAQPHGPNDEPEADYWLAWAPYIPLTRDDIAAVHKIERRRFQTKEAAMAYADKTWPPGEWQDSE